ncbi:MAG: HypC/HybG/HupF family hydrogenase formation chaperone [Candidatus Zixiibacteriota bacterium]
MCLAVPGKIISIEGDGLERTAKVSFSGIVKSVNLALVPEAEIGRYVLVHAGIALNIVDESEAALTLEYFREMDVLREAEDNEA